MSQSQGVLPVSGARRLLTSVLTLEPHDTATESGRSLERYRRATLTSAATVLGRGVGLLSTLVMVPLTIGYLGDERYGIWMTLSTLVALLSFADLGLGNGLLNAISTSHGRDDRSFARSCVSSAFFLLMGIATVLAIAFAACYPWIPWDRVFNVSPEVGLQEAGPAMAMFLGCFLAGLPLGIVNRIQTGYQQGFVNAGWQAVGSLLTLAALLVAIWQRAALPLLVLALAGAPLVATAINGAVLFLRTMPWLMPSWSAMNWQAMRQIGHVGFMFLILQICVALQSSVDNLIVAQFLGPVAVTQLSVPAKLFSVAGSLAMIALTPLWPAYGEALARGDNAWVKRTVKRSTLLAACCSAVIVVPLVLFGRPIVQAWAGAEVQPSSSLLLALGCWTVLSTVGAALAMFLNAANIVAFQTLCAVAVGITATVAKIQVAATHGGEGIVWAMNATYLLFTMLPLAWFVPALFRRDVSMISSQQRSVTA